MKSNSVKHRMGKRYLASSLVDPVNLLRYNPWNAQAGIAV